MKNLLVAALISLNAFLIFTVVKSIKTEADQIKQIANRENAIKEKLSFIRDLQQVHKSQKGYYAPTWTELGKYQTIRSI